MIKKAIEYLLTSEWGKQNLFVLQENSLAK